MAIRYTALPTDAVRALQRGGPDANGQPPELCAASSGGYQCRHCLRYVPEGNDMLLVAYRPFPALDPYAETGPICLCAEECDRYEGPEIFAARPDYLIKGYGADDRIVYGTGEVVPLSRLDAAAEAILADDRVVYVHARSARNNCYQFRIDPL